MRRKSKDSFLRVDVKDVTDKTSLSMQIVNPGGAAEFAAAVEGQRARIASIAQALGDAITVDPAARSVRVRRQTGIVADFIAQRNQILENGSIIMVVATDAPLDHLRLERLGRRALAGLARTGSSMSNGSGDYVIVFSTRRPSLTAQPPNRLTDSVEVVRNDAMSGLFQAAIDATEEAIYNSLLRAETVRGYRGVVRALPIDSTVMILQRYGAIHHD